MYGEYHRPASLDEALALLSRRDPVTRPLAGGVHFRRGIVWPTAVVDLAGLSLKGITRGDTTWEIGATTTLEQLSAAEELSAVLRRAALRQAPRNGRQRATIGGVIASRDSGALLACLLAMETHLRIEPGARLLSLSEYLKSDGQEGHLITAVSFSASRTCAFAEICRTPSDLPILVVAASASHGELLAAAGGADQATSLLQNVSEVLEDAAAPGGIPWRDDGRGSAEYRRAMIPVLLRRAVAELRAGGEVTHAG